MGEREANVSPDDERERERERKEGVDGGRPLTFLWEREEEDYLVGQKFFAPVKILQ